MEKTFTFSWPDELGSEFITAESFGKIIDMIGRNKIPFEVIQDTKDESYFSKHTDEEWENTKDELTETMKNHPNANIAVLLGCLIAMNIQSAKEEILELIVENCDKTARELGLEITDEEDEDFKVDDE